MNEDFFGLRDGKEITVDVDFMDPDERFFRNALADQRIVEIVNGDIIKKCRVKSVTADRVTKSVDVQFVVVE